jgi:hypothetical protein
MKWTLPLSVGVVFAACLTYLHVVPAQKMADSSRGAGGACCETTSCCVAGSACCAEGSACCAEGSTCPATETFPCYVIHETNGLGDLVKSVDVTACETVSDILTKASETLEVVGTDIWISRLGDDGARPEQILRVNFLDMSEGIDPATNYQITPYDRIFIKDQDKTDQ